MNCRGVSRRLSAFIDDDLSPGIKQAVDEHLACCAKCKRRMTELETIVRAAHELPSLNISQGFSERVVQAVHSRKESSFVLGAIRFRFVFAGASFVATALVVFFLIGPKSGLNDSSSFASKQARPSLNATAPDFYTNPGMKVDSFPVPESAMKRDLSGLDSLMMADTSSRIDEFILPEVQKAKENVNVKF